MNLEQQVCSLDLAKRLKELGVKQESPFFWSGDEEHGFVADTWKERFRWPGAQNISAFTVAELGEMLPTYIYNIFPLESRKAGTRTKTGAKWLCGAQTDKGNWKAKTEADTEADARAKMRCYLLENELVNSTDPQTPDSL